MTVPFYGPPGFPGPAFLATAGNRGDREGDPELPSAPGREPREKLPGEVVFRLSGPGVHGASSPLALPWNRGKEAGRRNEFVYFTEEGEKALYLPIEAPRAGGAERISMMCQAMRRLRLREQEIVAPVLFHQRSAQSAAVITNVEAEGRDEEIVYPDLMTYLVHEPNAWFGNDAVAVEVDAHPQKKRFIRHFEDIRNRIEVPTLLVVSDENSRALAQKHLKEEGAEIVERLDPKSDPKDVEVVAVNPENVELPSAVEAEHDPDKRLYRQMRESCKVNGLMKEYREFVK
ncbi:hypothetical protein AKJ66_02660 [candidate division MSBL1 archaeon SCGC-AAA259E22]|uniref:Uncharacterized protein n=1 Tax=candidate division MSBL1 archaeon SCGC-AAA259E22 TaxID=1698265 RepID=A0A133UG05_9EURY|nr:hypothetical protein AKJ66_02660 [candidate division MSBL1 archaeon SCGC-AAA259E22]